MYLELITEFLIRAIHVYSLAVSTQWVYGSVQACDLHVTFCGNTNRPLVPRFCQERAAGVPILVSQGMSSAQW